MKTIKKLTAILLSMVILLSFALQSVCAETNSYYELYPNVNSITRNFRINDEFCDSYARASATVYDAENCDLTLRTYVVNEYKNSLFEDDYHLVAYVSVYVELDTGLTGLDETIAPCPYLADGVTAMMYGTDPVDYDSEDIVTYFESVHKIYTGSRHFPFPEEHDEYDGSDTIHISSPQE